MNTRHNDAPATPQEFEEKVVQVSRVSKKTKGGNKMGFSVLVVVGDRKGRVGVGLGKAKDVQSSVRKGVKKAKKHMITVPMDGTTIPFSVRVKRGAGQVLLKPAPKGSGLIAGGPVRAVIDAAGIRDISSKILGSPNQSVNVYATFKALQQIQRIVAVKGIKLKSIADIEKEEAKKLEEIEAAKKAAHAQLHPEKVVTRPVKVGKPAQAKPDAMKPKNMGKPAAAPASPAKAPTAKSQPKSEQKPSKK